MITARRTFAVLAVLVAMLGLVAPQAASAADRKDRPTIVTFRHGAVNPTGVQGSGLGTVRFFTIPGTVDGKPGVPATLFGTLTTIALDPTQNRDVRASNLTIVVGGEANQLVIGGISVYPADGSTLAPGTKTLRPIIGGSGIYAGARGDVVSTNLGAEGWIHVFRIRR
jgi:hypothetical protein